MVKFKEFRIDYLFTINSSKHHYFANQIDKIFDIQKENTHPYVVRSTKNNGIRGYIYGDKQFLNSGNTISFAQDTFVAHYQKLDYYTGNKVKILVPRFATDEFNVQNVLIYIAVAINKLVSSLTWGVGSTTDSIGEFNIQLPIDSEGNVNWDYMNQYVRKIESQYVRKIESYLTTLGFKTMADVDLTEDDRVILDRHKKAIFKEFRLGNLFGPSTRGKRLKSTDRIPGNIPLITAGESNQGISDFIGNPFHIFNKNTITIDMFGSAKYRGCEYGADDHVSVIHTEKMNKYINLYVTTSINKASHNGKFDYSRNFYPKDADDLLIRLPARDTQPDYQLMSKYSRVMQKKVVKNLKKEMDQRLVAYKKLINS